MRSCTLVCWVLAPLLVPPLPFCTAVAQLPATPTDAEVNERIRLIERTTDSAARMEALKWLQKHAVAKNAKLAIPVLERIICADPASKVREEAVLTFFDVAKKHRLPCPLALLEAIFDQEDYVRQSAGTLATQFTEFAPGAVDLALRAAWSEHQGVRSYGLNLLALAAPCDPRALAVLETAKNDRSFQVRHNSHCYKFQANKRMDEYLTWLIRLQEDRHVLDPIPKDEALCKQEEFMRNLAVLGSAQQIQEWCEKRPDDLAAALVQLLQHESPVVRRGAVRLIGVAAAKPEPPRTDSAVDSLSRVSPYLFPEKTNTRKSGSQPQTRLEKSKVAPCLEKRKVRERLEKLRDHDPDRAVRAASVTALDRLTRLQTKP